MNVLNYFIFIRFNPNHTTYFHNILETLSWMFLNDIQHQYKIQLLTLKHKKLSISYNYSSHCYCGYTHLHFNLGFWGLHNDCFFPLQFFNDGVDSKSLWVVNLASICKKIWNFYNLKYMLFMSIETTFFIFYFELVYMWLFKFKYVGRLLDITNNKFIGITN
jgi:hypothetical protein